MTDKIFEINEFGVCINPNEIIFENEKFTAKIETAYIDDGWYFGTSAHTKNSGHSFCVSKDKNRFDTEKEAINKAESYLIDRGFNIKNKSENEQLTFDIN